MTNSTFIKSEIERFESVHPSIYSIYELLDEIRDQKPLSTQIREHVMIIEDSFVNSQEWTLSRSVLDIRIGLLGSLSSGKSALVHRFLTGTYMQEESPEGGRFKKELQIENQNYLLLIRDEANAPDAQFTHWVDAVIFVFSLENEESFKSIYQFYTKMSHYRNINEMPLILVGTQDSVNGNHPRVIQEDRAKKLAHELKRCTYFETCATYGLNVDRVFHDVCSKIVQQRYGFSSTIRSVTPQQQSPVRFLSNSQSVPQTSSMYISGPLLSSPTPNLSNSQFFQTPTMNGVVKERNSHHQSQSDKRNRSFKDQQTTKLTILNETHFSSGHDVNEQLTPTSTPTQKRKESKRKSNLFTPGKKDEEKSKNDRLGHGRAIPIRQGFLYKKATNSINREWKKKYVVLLDDGRIIYHPSFHDYENDVHGKEIILQRTSIKIPGSNKPRITVKNSSHHDSSSLGDKGETPNSKKRHRRHQTNLINSSATNHNGNDDDGDENVFLIVSLDKQWFFEAQSNEDRDEWVKEIEQQILLSFQTVESSKSTRANIADLASVQTIKQVSGNSFCADCEQTNPSWASLNLGALICRDCASLHRNLGTHLSRVRSLELDEWPSDLVQIMHSIGNKQVNAIWEANKKNRTKPQSNCSSSERERWIREKYEQKLFLIPLSLSTDQIRQTLIDAIEKQDLPTVILLLAHGKLSIEDLNSFVHLAASTGNITILQLLLWNGADPFVVDSNGRTTLQCANGDCVRFIESLTTNRSDWEKHSKTISPLSRLPTSSSAPPYDKLPSTVI